MVIADNLYLTAALGWPYWPLCSNHFLGREWIVCRTGTKPASCTSPSLCYFPPPPHLLLIMSLFERQGMYKVKSFVIKATTSQKLGVNLCLAVPCFVSENTAFVSADVRLKREVS